MASLDTQKLNLIVIEKCRAICLPSAFDRKGARPAVKVPEGDDKPAKYPGTFAGASVILINKIDLIKLYPVLDQPCYGR